MELMKTSPVGTGRADYADSRPFCVWTESHFPEVDAVVDMFADEIGAVLRIKIERTKLKKHVRKIILDLFVAFNANPDRWVDYPRRKQQYDKGTRMHRMHLKHGPFLAVVDALCALDYAEHLEGDRTLGLQSSMRATTLLIEAIHTGRVEPRMVYLDHEPIYLKDDDGNYIDFKETFRLGLMANRIVALNRLLLGTIIELALTEDQRREYIRQAKHVPEMHRRTLYRVFNRGRFSFGGRFYGHAVQGIKSWWRQFVRINGEPVSELDYGGMHIRLLYSKAGTVPPPGDVYDIGVSPADAERFRLTWGIELRAVLKLLLLIGINAKTKTATIAATMAELYTPTDDQGQSVQMPEDRSKEFRAVLWKLLDMLLERHPAIKDFIGTDQGIKLQRLDSDIADMILAEFVKRGLPIIPIHDSFLVREQDRDLLWSVMEEAWRKYVPEVEPVIEDKAEKWKVQRKSENPCAFSRETGSHMEENGETGTGGVDYGLVG